MMKRTLLAAAFAATLVGCAAPRTVIERPAFPVAEYEALPKTGTATVTGQAFLKTRGGDVKTAAGNTVALHPVTSYSTFSYDNQIMLGRAISPADPRQAAYARTTTADATGRFTFKDLPPGDYYVVTNVTWEVPAGGYTMSTQGGMLAKRITAKNGEVTDVIVTR